MTFAANAAFRRPYVFSACVAMALAGQLFRPAPTLRGADFGFAPVVLSKASGAFLGAEKKPDVEERRKGSKDDTKPRELTFDDLKFEMERNADFDEKLLTEKIEKLDAKRIKLRGYMLPSFQQEGITQFVLVRDNMECCFGPGAMLYDCVIVDMDTDKSAAYSIRPVTVEGVFTVEELEDEDGKTLAIYHLQAVSVK